MYITNINYHHLSFNYSEITKKAKNAEKKITDIFIKEHAKILINFGGKESKEYYIAQLSKHKENPAKFDKAYEILLNNILNQ